MPPMPEGRWQQLFNVPDNVSAAQRCTWAWSFRTPEWMRQDREALRLVFRLRVLALAFALGVFGTFFFFTLGVAVNIAADLT
jgi:hypothetical protein